MRFIFVFLCLTSKIPAAESRPVIQALKALTGLVLLPALLVLVLVLVLVLSACPQRTDGKGFPKYFMPRPWG